MLFAAAFTALPTYRALMRTGLTEAASGPPGLGRGRWPFDEMAPAPATRVAGRSDAERGAGRWSADAWLLVREGDQGTRLAGVDPASYGADQVGAVLRYALAPDSLFDPQAYGRASKALVRDGEAEVAGGLSVRLARRVPVRLHGEVRVTERPGNTGDRTEVRPAAFIATGLPRQEIGPGLEADAYLQAGYVGGEFDTGFVDGRAVVEAPVIRDETRRFALGGGVWGGAQRDVSRLDAGPTASLSLSTGGASLRASADYRVRIAGDATPGDGPAVTLAVSF